MSEQEAGAETWHELGRQFQELGKGLAHAFRTTFEDEDNRQHLEAVRAGLEAMVEDIGQAVADVRASPGGEKVREEAEKALGSARAAGEQALKEARPHLLSAMRHVNAELQRAIGRMEHRDSGPGVDTRDKVGEASE